MNVNITLNEAQLKALDEYRFQGRYLTRSDAARTVFRAGLVMLAARAPSIRERDAASVALELWDAADAPIPPQDPQP